MYIYISRIFMHIRAQRRTHYRHRTRARVLSAYAHGRCTDNFARVHPWKRELRRGVRESLCFTTVYVHPANSVAMRAVARARQPDTHTHIRRLSFLFSLTRSLTEAGYLQNRDDFRSIARSCPARDSTYRGALFSNEFSHKWQTKQTAFVANLQFSDLQCLIRW